MNIRRFCILALVSTVSMFAWAFASELPAQATPFPGAGSTEAAGLIRAGLVLDISHPEDPYPPASDPDELDPDDSGLDGSATADFDTSESDSGDSIPSDPAGGGNNTPHCVTDSVIVGHTLSQGAGSASVQSHQASRVDFGLEEIVVSIEKILPPNWEVTSVKRKQVPRKWLGPADAVLVRLEDRSIILHHSNGFDYHPFYKLWLCPSAWQGMMENVTIQGDEGPSILLGINHRMKVLYLTLGANTWPKGPEVLRKTLNLTALPITASLKHAVDSSMRMKLYQSIAPTESSSPGLLLRVFGMENDGPLAYLEYSSAVDKIPEGFSIPSACEEYPVATLTEEETEFLANHIFSSYPGVRTVYIRALCHGFFCDKIIDKADTASRPAAAVQSSAR